MLLPVTVTKKDVVSSPSLFVTLTVYSPRSLRFASGIFRTDSPSIISNTCLVSLDINSPSWNQVTIGAGLPAKDTFSLMVSSCSKSKPSSYWRGSRIRGGAKHINNVVIYQCYKSHVFLIDIPNKNFCHNFSYNFSKLFYKFCNIFVKVLKNFSVFLKILYKFYILRKFLRYFQQFGTFFVNIMVLKNIKNTYSDFFSYQRII